jgi:hypothetical protein
MGRFYVGQRVKMYVHDERTRIECRVLAIVRTNNPRSPTYRVLTIHGHIWNAYQQQLESYERDEQRNVKVVRRH